MSQASDYLENALLNHLMMGTEFSQLSNIWIALCSASISDSDTGSTITECSYTGYARKSTSGSDWDAADSGTVDNTAELAFAQCTAGSDTASYFALVDAASAGNMLCYGSITTPLAISAGVTPKFAAGDLDVSLA